MLNKLYTGNFIILLIIFICFICIPVNSAHCVDIHHHIVSEGLHYVPGPNPCTLCICDKGTPKWCKQILCLPPQNCKSYEVGNSCCEFKCLDDILKNETENYNETSGGFSGGQFPPYDKTV